MPELPEVETVRKGLEKFLPNKIITDVWFDWQKSFPNNPKDVNTFLLGAHIEAIDRRGKALIINLSTQYSLVIHLKMTGQLVYRDEQHRFGAGHPSDSLVNELPDKTTHVIFTFFDESKLFFNDQRKFGWVRLMPTIEVPNLNFFKQLGPEPLGSDFTAKDFRQRLMRRLNSNVKSVLLDQTIIAGVGNIYADESLWAAKIHPQQTVKSLSQQKTDLLFKELRSILELAIAKGGSTNHTYVNAEGKKGSYMDFARVFSRTGLPCPRCETSIVKLRVANRGTHICPKCQKLK